VNAVAHEPVLVEEVVHAISSVPSGIVVDATLGAGGHTKKIIESRSDLTVIGFDRDVVALEEARSHLVGHESRIELVHARFSELSNWLGVKSPISAVLADLGVSSMQLDEAARGFSFRNSGPLDMRMDQTAGTPLAELLGQLTEEQLVRSFLENGVGSLSRRYARAILGALPIYETAHLREVIYEATPIRLRGGQIHPATKVFQALRRIVNDEEAELKALLSTSIRVLQPDGKLLVISYHSGEDRVVKGFMTAMETGGCHCPSRLGCVCGAMPVAKRTPVRALKPGAIEIERNRRARSARLRILTKTTRLGVEQTLERWESEL
jgi:16S rRNA (cytosine1402-N4)-methyltransferase